MTLTLALFISHFSDLLENTGFCFAVPEFLSLSLFFFLEPFKSAARRYQGDVFSSQVNFRGHIYNPLSISGNPMSAIGSDVGRRLGLRTYTASLKLKKTSSIRAHWGLQNGRRNSWQNRIILEKINNKKLFRRARENAKQADCWKPTQIKLRKILSRMFFFSPAFGKVHRIRRALAKFRGLSKMS